jgi:hypothetical protein
MLLAHRIAYAYQSPDFTHRRRAVVEWLPELVVWRVGFESLKAEMIPEARDFSPEVGAGDESERWNAARDAAEELAAAWAQRRFPGADT